MRTSGHACGFVLVAAAFVGGCATHRISNPAGPIADILLSVFLIGDAGDPVPAGDPVLQALARAVTGAGPDSAIVFLGDNLYPRGLPAPGHRDRPEMERRLDAQIEVARQSGHRAVFVPGNHDWDRMGADGWGSVQRAEEFIRDKGKGLAVQLPSGGCPGPAAVDLGSMLRVVLLDTQWWLHKKPKPRDPTSTCTADTEAEVADRLAVELAAGAGRHVIVAAHHPLATRGKHGGYFPISAHIFPLRDLKDWMWIPLPIVGSIYPILRMVGITSQDLSGSDNERMRAALGRAMSAHPPLLFAAGHEHTLQVFRGPFARFSAVSGSGIDDHQTPVGRSRTTLHASSRPGFMRVDVSRQGSVRLAVIEVNGTETREVDAFLLTAP